MGTFSILLTLLQLNVRWLGEYTAGMFGKFCPLDYPGLHLPVYRTEITLLFLGEI